MKEFSAKAFKLSLAHYLIPLGLILACTPLLSSATALLLGIFIALIFGNPYRITCKKISPLLLGIAIVGVGGGMNLAFIKELSLNSFFYIVISIIITFFLGITISRLLRVDKETSLLVCMGTAICGGSAIAALAPVIRAKDDAISLALIEVFLLNAIALFIFPHIGHYVGLNQADFGLWSALAIHDTSSVVGATMSYGQEALMVGTTIKLVRALGIVPIVAIFSFLYNRKDDDKSFLSMVKVPWFIVGFLIMAAMVSLFPSLVPLGEHAHNYGKQALVVVLFLIGTGINKESLRSIGLRSFLLAFSLWVSVSGLSLLLIHLSSLLG